QKWVALRYTGTTTDINIHTAEPEFCEWRWLDPHALINLAVPFKRDVYSTLMESFAGLLRP
ncbi:MAG: RNA pyrophosphohydrolase, partial [Candidatus Puniceispirillaceae bacterium]